MATSDDQTLASLAVMDSSSFNIDPALTAADPDMFLTESLKVNGDPISDEQNNGMDDATVSAIKQSLSEAQAHADKEARLKRTKRTRGAAKAEKLKDDREEEEVAPAVPGRLGESSNPVTDATIHLAPFSKANRQDDDPHPEHMQFVTKSDFDIWFAGETSWCHFVQRRTTTPEKRAQERMRARRAAHEKALAGEPSRT